MDQLKKWGDYLSGYMSGIISITVCAPLDITRTRLNLNKTTAQPIHGFVETFVHIFKKRGYRGYYDGKNCTLTTKSLVSRPKMDQLVFLGF